MNKIYIVDDDTSILISLQRVLQENGYHVQVAESPDVFLKMVADKPPAVAILDIFLGENQIDGEQLISVLNGKSPNTQCLIMSGESDIQKTLACLKHGALDFLEKPISLPRLLTSVRNAISLFNSKESALDQYQILGNTNVMQKIKARIKKLAPLNESVVILGESGTGKELAAQNLHLYSNRHSRPLYKVNCTALNTNLLESELFGYKAGSFTGADKDKTGFFEASDKSSLFIDEIGDFDLTLQSKILRVLQEKKVTPVGSTMEVHIDTRLIFATHHDLEAMIGQNKFREDLYYRISTFTIELPPLRQRLQDIDILARHFLYKFVSENNLNYREFSKDALNRLKQYHYPGNIRELDKIVKNAAFFSESEIITAEDIEFSPRLYKMDIWQRTQKMTINEARNYFEKQFIQRRLKTLGYDLNKTADSLNIIINNLYRKLNQHNIELPPKK